LHWRVTTGASSALTVRGSSHIVRIVVRPRIRFAAFLVAFTALSLFSAAMSWLFTVRTGASMWTLQPDASATAWYVVAMNLVYWGTWAPLAPVVLLLGSWWRIDAAHWRRSLPVHFAAGFGVACVHVVGVATGRTLLQRVVGMQVSWEERVWEMFFRTIDWELTLYGALVALQHAVDYYGELRARDLRAAQLETRLVEAQLQALQRQLHPHFLFNTLHAISALVHRDPDKADAMIERLSDLLRVTLDKVGIQEVTLGEEIEYLQADLLPHRRPGDRCACAEPHSAAAGGECDTPRLSAARGSRSAHDRSDARRRPPRAVHHGRRPWNVSGGPGRIA